MIEIGKGIFVSEENIVFKASRSSGPGGQNVNKVNSRMTLVFDVVHCESFSDAQRQRILKELATRADKNGVIRVASQKFRTQQANRRAAIERLKILLREALKTRPIRKETKIPYSAKRQRLERKRQRSFLKQQRVKRDWARDLVD